MKYILAILIGVFLIGNLNLKACSCGYLGGFVYSNQAADLVVYGKVLGYDTMGTHGSLDSPYSMKFLVIEKLRGIEKKDTIVVWGDYGADCRPYISHFKPNTEWILAVEKLHGDKEGYEISICGEFYVPVIKGQVAGQIFGWKYQDKQDSYPYDQIKNLVNTPYYYPLQRPRKVLSEDLSGNDYVRYCETLPKPPIDFMRINEIVNHQLKLPIGFMYYGDSYLVNARVVISEDGSYFFNGTYENYYAFDLNLLCIENQLDEILTNLGDWQPGLEDNKPVRAELVIPILIKR